MASRSTSSSADGPARSSRARDCAVAWSRGTGGAVLRRAPFALALCALSSCADAPPVFTAEDSGVVDDVAVDAGFDGGPEGAGDAARVDAGGYPDLRPAQRDAVDEGGNVAPDAACTSSSVEATVERLPVDIIWVVDNSVSMAPAIDEVIRGLNSFASLVGSRGLDYRVVMLSLRNAQRNVTVPDGRRYAVCIPPPLAGDARCGNGPRFLHSSVDIRSTQPLEQLLGTLGQTMGYTAADPRGGEPWRSFLRPEATKSIVVVTDDQSRLSADLFETFVGGTNPSSRTFDLPPGVLHPSWGGLFNDYTFSGIYGWGSESDVTARCMYPDGSSPPASGMVYTTLVQRRGGARARICDGSSAWGPFFDQIATAVERASRIQCDLAIPPPPGGQVLDPRRVNVLLRGSSQTLLGKVSGAGACTSRGGWYYDDEARPTRVFLCPASCEAANAAVRGGSAQVVVQFGCITIPG